MRLLSIILFFIQVDYTEEELLFNLISVDVNDIS